MLRKLIWTATFGLMLAPFSIAQAQLACTASAPALVNLRSTGLVELTGDVVVTCTGGTPLTAPPYPAVNIGMFFNAAVTSRPILAGTTYTEAVLLVDNPAADQQSFCASTVCAPLDNVFASKLDSFNSLSWSNIPINPPGAGAQRVLRFKNIRINATNLPSNGTSFVFITLTGASVGSLQNPQQSIGSVKQAFTLEQRSAADAPLTGPLNFVACTGNNADLAGNPAAAFGTPGGRTLNLKFSEGAGFPNAFRKRSANTSAADPAAPSSQDDPMAVYNTESGYTNTRFPAANGGNLVGLADSGTLLRAVFANIPANVRVFVTSKEVAPGSTQAVDGNPTTKARLTSTPGRPFTPVAPDSAADGGIKLVPPSGEVQWEILETDSANVESVSFGVVVAYSGSPQPASGTLTVSGGLGPESKVAIASQLDPIPRFQGMVGPISLVSLNVCRTTLLFQFITNQSGFDTGVAVSNTSRDTLSTTPQSGRCTATFFPTPFNSQTQGQYPVLTSPNLLQGGEQWTFTISAQRPGFQGYMMVGCDFQFAHGYAFISDAGGVKLAQGYQALIIPDRPRVADPVTTSPGGSGEQLLQ